MKFLGLLLLVACAGQISAQRSDFVEYLLALQYASEPLHEWIVNFFAESRQTLSSELTALNDAAVHEITNGLHTVIVVRDRTDEAIAAATTNENSECIGEMTANWFPSLEATGSEIQQCADQHVNPIYELVENFHLFIQSHNRLAFNAQNMVLNVFTELNPLLSAEEITPTIERQIDEVFEEFERDIRPDIEGRLVQISNLRLSVPAEVHTCVDESVVRLNAISLEIIAGVAGC